MLELAAFDVGIGLVLQRATCFYTVYAVPPTTPNSAATQRAYVAVSHNPFLRCHEEALGATAGSSFVRVAREWVRLQDKSGLVTPSQPSDASVESKQRRHHVRP